MNRRGSILILIIALVYCAGFTNIHPLKRNPQGDAVDRKLEVVATQHAGISQPGTIQPVIPSSGTAQAAPVPSVPAGTNKTEEKQTPASSKEKVVAQKARTTTDLTAITADAAAKLLAKLPTHGEGLLRSVRNLTKFGLTIQPAEEKTIIDQLPEGTTVRIKSLDPQFGAGGKYYTIRKSKDAKDPDGLSFKPDTSDPKDPATHFFVTRRISKNLKDWISFTNPMSEDRTLQVAPKTLDVGFFNRSFREEADTQSHWSLVGKTLDSCALKNRKTGGHLSYFSGEKDIKTTKSEPLMETFGIQQPGFEIIRAIFAEEKGSQYNVTDVIRSIAYKEGKIAIKENLYKFLGKTRPPGVDTNATLTIQIKNGATTENVVIKNAILNEPIDYVYNLPYQGIKGVIPIGGAQTGVMVKLEGKDWRGPALEYNTLISIASDKHPTHLLWAHGARHWGKHDDFIVGNPSQTQLYNGPHMFIIKSKADPKKTGPINYGEEIEIWSVFQSPNEFWREELTGSWKPGMPAGEVQLRKWWVDIHSWAHARIFLTDPNGSNLDENDKKKINSSQATFTLASPNKLTGIVYQSDLVNIVSKMRTNNGDDARGFNEDEKKRFADQKMWFDFSNWQHYWGDGRVEVIVRDEWGAQGNRYMNHYLPEQPRDQKYDLAGDRSIRWGDFRIQAANTRYVDEKTLAAIYAASGITPQANPGKLMQISVKNSNEVWAVNAQQEAWKWNGKVWSKIPTPNPLKHICVSAKGDVWAVGIDNKIWQFVKQTWVPLGGDPMKQIAIRSGKEVWGIGEDDFVYLFDGRTWEKNSPVEGGIISVSASSRGDVWAADSKKRTWKLTRDKELGWIAVNTPDDKATLIQLAVRSDKDVWATSDEGTIYRWNGTNWDKQAGLLGYVAVAADSKTVVLKSEKRFVQEGTTTDANDQPITGPTTALKIEIIRLGIGGNLPAGKTVEINIPASKAPRVSGFATTKIDNFESGAKLIVIPLLGKGGAWPENSLLVPGRTTVSFLASAEDAGDIQILFGPEISDNFTWKVVIGGWDNTKSAIIKRTVVKGQPKETIMYEINQKQNPLAAAAPGTFTPYWVSYDKGFIMVGMGLPGQNIFMAQRVKEIEEAEITRVGFSSNKTIVQYAEIQFLPPITLQKPERVYAHSTKPIALGANQAAFTWTKYPFRSYDRGSVSFEIKGTDNVVLALGQDTSTDTPHYAIVFSSDKASIMIKKWDPEKKKYIDRAGLPKSTYPAINLNPNKSIPVWVSFQDGMFSIGHGPIGQNPVLVYSDLNDYQGIHTVGFGTFGQNPATISNLQATPPVLIRLEDKEEAYQTGQPWYQYTGAVTVIMPFEYQFMQKEDSVIATDLLTNEVFYSGATPGGGNLFKFLLQINPDGFPKLDWETEPENAAQTKVKQALVQSAASVELQKAKAELEEKEGARIRQLANDASKIEKAKYDAVQGVTRTMTAASTAAGMASGIDLTVSAIALGTSLGIGLAATMVGKWGETFAQNAAKIDMEGAKAASAHRAKSETLAAIGHQLEFQSSLLSGKAQFAFKDPTSYVYVDNPQRSVLGAAGLPAEVQDNAQKAADIISAIGAIKPTNQKNFLTLLRALQDVVALVTHAYVMNDFLSKKFMLYLADLYAAYSEIFKGKADATITNNVINLLFSVINNGYMLTASTSEAVEDMYTWINKLAHNLLTKSASISLKSCYGEYIWLPVPATQSDQVSVEITVQGSHDVFVCFAKDPEKVRNTPKDIYEIVLGGWDNTKHAIRTQSLGRAVKEFYKEDYPETMLGAEQTYKITLVNGKITINVQGKKLTWTDPYPIKGIKWVGISNWDSPINFKKISLKSKAPAKKQKPSSVPSTPTADNTTRERPEVEADAAA